jgi:hypothetical protein
LLFAKGDNAEVDDEAKAEAWEEQQEQDKEKQEEQDKDNMNVELPSPASSCTLSHTNECCYFPTTMKQWLHW